MKIKKVRIIPGCISCGSCEIIAPEVFELQQTAQVRPDAQITGNEEKIIEAALMCPVQAIEVEKEEGSN
ncbi:MAG: ferredoxin [bacterium]